MLRKQNKTNSDLGMFFKSRFVGKKLTTEAPKHDNWQASRSLDVIIVVVVVDVDILILSRVDKEG